jgi:hypothetical protein
MTHHALSLSPPDDYRFTYAGPAGTFTPVHRDVYGSYSWSSNIVGKKRWWLIPPEDTELFLTRSGGEDLVFDVREVDEVLWKGKVLVVEQQAGETIFVPSGWHHQVENLDFVSSYSSHVIMHRTAQRGLLLNSASPSTKISRRRTSCRQYITISFIPSTESRTRYPTSRNFFKSRLSKPRER